MRIGKTKSRYLKVWRNHQSRTANPASRILSCISLAIAIQRVRGIPAFTPTPVKSATVTLFSLPFTEVASKPSQLENNMKATGFVIPADAMAEIDKITGFHHFERHVG